MSFTQEKKCWGRRPGSAEDPLLMRKMEKHEKRFKFKIGCASKKFDKVNAFESSEFVGIHSLAEEYEMQCLLELFNHRRYHRPA